MSDPAPIPQWQRALIFAAPTVLAMVALSALAQCVAGCRMQGEATTTPGKSTAADATAAVSTASSRVASHVEAARATVAASVELTPAHALAALGNLDAALAGLPRPTQADRTYVLSLKVAEDYRKAALAAEARALIADRALADAESRASAEREGREQDRADADARLWRIASVGLVLAGAVTAYVGKTWVRSAILCACGAGCAIMPRLLASAALATGIWVALAGVLVAAGWAAWHLWHAPPPVKAAA